MAAATGLKGIWKFAAAGDTLSGVKKISHLVWNQTGGAASDSLIVHDSDGNIVAEAIADAAEQTIIIPLERRVDGLDVDTMTNGTLMAYEKDAAY